VNPFYPKLGPSRMPAMIGISLLGGLIGGSRLARALAGLIFSILHLRRAAHHP
jgi:hypothetical protein